MEPFSTALGGSYYRLNRLDEAEQHYSDRCR